MQVAYDMYYSHCIEDSCSCFRSGDCDCFCNAVTAYVHECNRHGIDISWRSTGECCTSSSSGARHRAVVIWLCGYLECGYSCFIVCAVTLEFTQIRVGRCDVQFRFDVRLLPQRRPIVCVALPARRHRRCKHLRRGLLLSRRHVHGER